MAHNVGRRAARRHGYRPRHALQRKKDLSTSGLVAAVGLTLTGVLVLGSALSIRYQPDQRVAVAAPTIRPATLPRVDAAPAGASAVAPPAVASYAGTCVASWYSSSGRTGSAVATAAIGSLSLGSTIRITNLANGLSTVVRIDSRHRRPARGA